MPHRGNSFFLIYLFLIPILFISPAHAQEIEPGLFSPSALISVETSMRELKKLYLQGGVTKTLHCGCFFNKLLEVFAGTCEHGSGPLSRKAKKILGWMHAMPPSVFASSLKCWNKPGCSDLKDGTDRGSRCCGGVSPKYKTREADMHNLFPRVSPGSIEGEEPALSPIFGGMPEYRFCSKQGETVSEPRPGARGDMARAYFYMSYQYNIPIPGQREDMLRRWHLSDPPDPWEEKRNSAIEIVQGNRNPFIDHPQLAERVKDF